MRAAILLALVAAACGADPELGPTITFADVELSPPGSWRMDEVGPTTRMWSPPDNPRKETLTVIVTPQFLGDGERALAATRRAQAVLRERTLLAEARVSTRSGLTGLRFDVRFRPDSAGGRLYERTHVSLVAGDHLIHVLYTARDPDPDRAVLTAVLATLKAGG